MSTRQSIEVNGKSITILRHGDQDYISLTDMVKGFGDDTMIYSWMRNRNTLEFIGIWEELNNPTFKGHEFVTFKSQAGLNSFNIALFGKTAKEWRDGNPNLKGNIRDYGTLEQLVVLSNLESINAVLISQNTSQKERLTKLNEIAIAQMKSLTQHRTLKRLK